MTASTSRKASVPAGPLEIDENTAKQVAIQAERHRIQQEYARREREIDSSRYLATAPAEVVMRQERFAVAGRLLESNNAVPRMGDSVLEIGCGQSGWLPDMLSLGLATHDLHGIDLDASRIAKARTKLGAACLVQGDANQLPWPDGSFRLVILSTVVSSILDSSVRTQVCAEAERVLAPGGAVLWYDLARNNPRNPGVRRVTKQELEQLFPTLSASTARVTLAPPLLRSLVGTKPPGRGRVAHWLAGTAALLPLLRTHCLAVLKKDGVRASRPFSRERELAVALDGDTSALRSLAEAPTRAPKGLHAALAVASSKVGIEAPSSWRRALHASTVNWMRLDTSSARVAKALAGVCDFTPIKGFDVGRRFHEPREARNMSDLDVLVDIGCAEKALESLREAGFVGLFQGARADSYLKHEGYCWPAEGPGGELLEVHLRLWGLLPEELAGEIVRHSQVPTPDDNSELGQTSSEHAWLLAAVHSWLGESERRFVDWWDMARIVAAVHRRGPAEVEAFRSKTHSAIERHDLQLPAALSAHAVAKIWSCCDPETSAVHAELSDRFVGNLRRHEHRVFEQWQIGGDVGIRDIVLARLRDSRRSRAGWRTLARAIWAHPGVVEREVRESSPFWWRRLRHIARQLRPTQSTQAGPTNGLSEDLS